MELLSHPRNFQWNEQRLLQIDKTIPIIEDLDAQKKSYQQAFAFPVESTINKVYANISQQ
jgi:hypothetical protein